MSVSDNLALINSKIKEICLKSDRNFSSINLIAVSKTKPSSDILTLSELGHMDFGENYVQEWLTKAQELSSIPLRWHFIGHLQSNKAKEIVGKVQYIHSISSMKLARKINSLAQEKKIIQKGFLQINLSQEDSKSGIYEEELSSIIKDLNELYHLEIVGFMTLPEFNKDSEKTRSYFRKLKSIQNQINQEQIYRKKISYLSMGMSHDFEIAIAEGATHIRIGSSIFGPRS